MIKSQHDGLLLTASNQCMLLLTLPAVSADDAAIITSAKGKSLVSAIADSKSKVISITRFATS